MTSSVIIRLAITRQPTLGHRSTLDTVNGTAIFKGKMYHIADNPLPVRTIATMIDFYQGE
jgi:hypothetical protein